MEFTEKAVVMTAGDVNRVLARMASQIVENNPDLSNVLLLGIRRPKHRSTHQRGKCHARQASSGRFQ